MAHNVQRIPAAAASLYGASYMPFATHANTAMLAALQKNAAMAAAATYGGYAGYVPQAFPAAATFQMPIHDVYQTYWDTHSINHSDLQLHTPRHHRPSDIYATSMRSAG